MAGVINPCAKCGAETIDNHHAKYQPAVLRMCSACMRIEQQNKEMKKMLEDERRERDYEQRAYEARHYTPTPEKPEAVLRRILSSREETASGENQHESMITMFLKEPVVKFFFWFFVVILILAAIGKANGS